MKCSYCYEQNINNKKSHITISDIDLIKTTIENLFFENFYEEIRFTLLGGEPITKDNINWFFEFFKNFKLNNIPHKIGCISNGLELSNNINNLKELKIDNVQLTLDGGRQKHNIRRVSKIKNVNSYDEVINSINLLLESNIKVSLRMNVDYENIKEIKKINNLILKNKWNDSNLFNSYIYPVTYGNESKIPDLENEVNILKGVLEEIKNLEDPNTFQLDFHGIDFINTILKGEIFIPIDKFCSSCSSQYVFDCNGNIYTCWWGSDINSFKIGNFRNEEIYNEKLEIFNKHNVNNVKSCLNCKYKYICGTGCIFKSYNNNKNFNSGNCSNFYDNINLYLRFLEDKFKI